MCSLSAPRRKLQKGAIVDIAAVQEQIQQHFEEFSSKGFRTLGVAYKDVGSASRSSAKTHETGMTFLGFLVLFDPPKPGIIETIDSLKTPRRFIEDHHRRQPPGRGQRQSAGGIIESTDPHRSRSSPDER